MRIGIGLALTRTRLLPAAALGTSVAIVSGNNTSVAVQGAGYRLTKSGGTAAWDGTATSAALVGDFTLMILPVAPLTPVAALGVSANPALANDYVIDHYWTVSGTDVFADAGSGIATGTASTTTAGERLWIVRSGSTLTWRKGGTSAATATTIRTATNAATLYFDASINTVGAQYDLDLRTF